MENQTPQIPMNVKKIPKEKQKGIIDLLKINGISVGMDIENDNFVPNENYGQMIKELKDKKIGFTRSLANNLKRSLRAKPSIPRAADIEYFPESTVEVGESITEPIRESTVEVGESITEPIRESTMEVGESITEPIRESPASEVIPLDNLNQDYINALAIADKKEDADKSGLDKYMNELIDVYSTLGEDFSNLSQDQLERYKNMSNTELEAELNLLRTLAITEQAKNRSLVMDPIVTEVQSVIGPQFTEESSGLPPGLLVESRAQTQTQEPEIQTQAQEPEIQAQAQAQEPETQAQTQEVETLTQTQEEPIMPQDINKSSTAAQLPFIKRYHPESLKKYFENSVYPIWDSVLEKNVLSSEENTEERIKIMDGIIKRHGDELFVYERKSDTLEEMNELVQLQFSLSRPHLGQRIHQSVNVDYTQLNKIKSLANNIASVDMSGGSNVGQEQVSQIENSLGLGIGGGSGMSVQKEEEYKFNIYNDRYLENFSRNDTTPVRTYEQSNVVVKETINSISGKSRNLFDRKVPKNYYPESATDFEF